MQIHVLRDLKEIKQNTTLTAKTTIAISLFVRSATGLAKKLRTLKMVRVLIAVLL